MVDPAFAESGQTFVVAVRVFEADDWVFAVVDQVVVDVVVDQVVVDVVVDPALAVQASVWGDQAVAVVGDQ